MMGDQHWYEDLDVSLERYCIVSGLTVHMIPGDRCKAHGAAPTMCNTDVRIA